MIEFIEISKKFICIVVCTKFHNFNELFTPRHKNPFSNNVLLFSRATVSLDEAVNDVASLMPVALARNVLLTRTFSYDTLLDRLYENN
jgi:hypothetical protein